MSIVVAVHKNHQTVMAADSLTCFGETQQVPSNNSVTAKIQRIDGSIVGSAGWGVYDCIIRDFLADGEAIELEGESEIFSFFLRLWHALHERYPFVNDQPQAKDSPFGDLDSSFLIANRSGIYKVSHDMDVCRFEKFFAIGSGAEYALGAIHTLYDGELSAEAIARSAVETAMAYDLHCGGEVTVLSLAAEDTWRYTGTEND